MSIPGQNLGLLEAYRPHSEAYEYLTMLITKSEEEAPIMIPESERRDAPFAMDRITFHSQIIKRRPLGIRVPELHMLGREASELAVRMQHMLMYLLLERRGTAQAPTVRDAAHLEYGEIDELNNVRNLDTKWVCSPADEEISLMLARIEELVELRWAIERRCKEIYLEDRARGFISKMGDHKIFDGLASEADRTEHARVLQSMRIQELRQ